MQMLMSVEEEIGERRSSSILLILPTEGPEGRVLER